MLRWSWIPLAWLGLAAIASAEEGPNQADPGPAGSHLARFFHAPFAHDDDPDGPISTDRPTFTPANTVVPRGRTQIESGFTYNHDLSRATRSNAFNFPELAVRVGVNDWLEFRTFWNGQTYSREVSRLGRPTTNTNGPSDMEIGFKSQLTRGDVERPWLPTSALITSIIAPTGGSSPYSARKVLPNVQFLYGWSLGEKFGISGSTGYLGIQERTIGQGSGSAQRFSQSLVGTFAATDKTTLFHEWYVFNYVNAADNRPLHFMDTGLLYRPTPNTQFDIRAGLGLGDRPTDFTAGAGFSIRF